MTTGADYLAAHIKAMRDAFMKMALSSGAIRLGAVLTWSLPGQEK